MPAALITRANTLALTALAILLAALGMITWDRFTATRSARVWVQHTHEVLDAIADLGIAIRDAETGQRGYLLTQDETYLAPYHAALGQVSLLQGDLQRLTADNQSQQAAIRTLGPLLQRKLEELGQSIQIDRDRGLESALEFVRSGTGQRLMAEIEAVLSGMAGEEQALREQRIAAADRAEILTRWLALGGATAAILMLLYAARTLARERMKTEQAEIDQRALATRLQTSLDSLSQGVGVFDADHCLTASNVCFQVLLDLPPPALRDGVPYAAIVEQTRATSGQAILETGNQIHHGRGGRSTAEPVVYDRTRSGDGHVLEVRRTPMPDGGFVVTLSDMTERARAETILRDAHKMQAVGQLTGGIAHDFNNLLTVILGNMEYASTKLGEGHPVMSRIERAVWAAQRGSALTQQLLAFARKQPLRPERLNISAVLPDMASLLKRTLGEHIDVRTVDAAGLWNTLADATQLESAVLNLALNARDAMPSGGRLTIEVANKRLDEEYARAHAEVTAGDYVMLAVSDTGHGMPPEVVEKAFEPFFTTKPDGKGTGLGLAMIFGFVKQSNGHVKIYSEPGQGTTVKVYLPRSVGAAMGHGSQLNGSPADLPAGHATVLVVEDETDVREIAVIILRDLGYRVIEAKNAEDALRVFGANAAAVDLVLTDVVLPGRMRGRDLAERIGTVRPEVKILYMSGYTENAIVHHGRLDEGVELISKPFSREQLARKVSQVLGASSERPPRSGRPINVVDLSSKQSRYE